MGLFDNAGNLSRAWSWGAIGQVGYQWFEVEGEVASQLLYGTVMTPGWFPFQNAGTTDEQLSHGRAFSLEIAFINLGTASVQPVYGPSLNLTSNQNPFAVHMARGAFARVNTPSDCLNLRETGSTTSAILTCLPDGTLVQLLPSPPKDPAPEYLAVQLPDGRTGWVKSEFLQR